MPEELPPSLQESILAALIFDERAGAALSVVVAAHHFDETYREIAERVLSYRRRYRRAPGRAHLDDLFPAALQGRLRNTLFALSDLAEGINGDYLISRAQVFVRGQQLQAALLEASGHFQGVDPAVDEVERVLYEALRFRTQTLDAGTFLSDEAKSLKFFDQPTGGISLGIPELDRVGAALFPKELLLYIAPKAAGKTWFCVHAGVEALMQRQRVLHVSLEWGEDRIAGRYFQRLFAGAIRPDKFTRAALEFDDDEYKSLRGYRTRVIAPKFNFFASGGRTELRRRMKPWGLKFRRLIIKEFPSGTLTLPQLEGYLDYLETQHKFIPTVVIVDYPKLMKVDSRNLRIDLGQNVVGLRGLAAQRNFALLAPHQGNRESLTASRVRSNMAGEDISVVQTADNVLGYSQTEGEREDNLARISVEHARNGESGVVIAITQSYATGQYVIQSARMTSAYWDKVQGGNAGDRDDE